MLDIQNVDWSKFRLAKSGRVVKLMYDKEPLQICTSSLYSPFGVKSVAKDWSNFEEYYIDCSMNNASHDSCVAFRECMQKMDEVIKNLVTDNKELFVSGKSSAINDDFAYTPIMKENGTYPKLIKLQLPRDKNGNFTCFLFDEAKQKVKLTADNAEQLLRKGTIFKCIIELSKIWTYNNKAGSIWNIVQLKLSENKLGGGNGADRVPNVYEQIMIED